MMLIWIQVLTPDWLNTLHAHSNSHAIITITANTSHIMPTIYFPPFSWHLSLSLSLSLSFSLFLCNDRWSGFTSFRCWYFTWFDSAGVDHCLLIWLFFNFLIFIFFYFILFLCVCVYLCVVRPISNVYGRRRFQRDRPPC